MHDALPLMAESVTEYSQGFKNFGATFILYQSQAIQEWRAYDLGSAGKQSRCAHLPTDSTVQSR